jgi:predicted nucleotidyltransferase component of viral defense system
LKKRAIKDVAASVRQKLLNNAKSTNRPFQEVLQYFAMERFLYRLAQSPYADKFVLKGALMFTVWGAPATRPTKDIDFLARTENTIAAVVPIIRAVCTQPVEPDGLVFDDRTVEGALIKEDADYEGIRVTFLATLQNARVSMQLDLGYGDVVVPSPKMAEYPVILDLPAPRVRAYSRETVVAEKFEAMVKLGQLNSRMKDFFDLWLLSRQFDFDGVTLATAIGKTFENRKTQIPTEALALSSAFADDPTKQTQWKGFLRKARLEKAPEDLHDVLDALREFLQPVAGAAREELDFTRTWNAPGPWRAS